MALRKCIPLSDAPYVVTKPMNSSSKLQENAQLALSETSDRMQPDIDMDLREVYFLIMHFLSAGPCQRTYGQLWNELIEHQLLPRRYHAWYSRNGAHKRDGKDDGLSFPLNYNNLVERYPHIEKNHLVKLLKQLLLRTASPLQGTIGGRVPNAAHVPTLLGTGSFSLLSSDMKTEKVEQILPPAHMRWPHMRADQVRGLSLREIGGGFPRHHRAPSVRAACYAIEKPSTMVQKMQNIKRLRGHRNAVYCAIFDRSGRHVITGSDDRLVKIWSMETAFCLASCRGHEGDITDLAVSFNNALVASSSNDCIIRVWRLPDGYPISVLRGHTGAVTALAFSPRPNCAHQLLSSSDDGTCRIWDARYSNFRPRIYVPRPSDSVTGKNGGPSSSNGSQSRQIFCCSFNANGTIFVTGSSDHLARVWNAWRSVADDSEQPNHEIDVLSGHENDVNYVQFSGCGPASRFCLIDSSKEENISKHRSPWISHDYIVTCSRDGSAIIWIPRSRRSHKAGRWTRSYHLKVPPPPMPLQPTRGGPRQRILPTPRGVNMIVWSLDNRFVLAAIMDCRICVWNAADGNLVHSLTGHTQSTYVLDVHPFNPRIAMSAGYDGKTIVWDIWEGTPIRIYDISRFKLVDGKFSPDGTSIILSDDVGQLYILSTGQGESQTDAKYDQFFLGDYRPLVQDTYGNTLDQESQLVPYRRNMQDLLCDSGMNPYPEPYQSMYQKRRLGALGVEWKPSSIRFAVGPDFSVDPDFQMLPLADLDILLEPLPEFIDVMEWEPEINVQSDDTDSEYNVPEEYSSGGEQASLSSSSSDDMESSTDDSDVEGNDGFRRSKRKNQKADIEIMTSSGRRVKKRNLDERDGNVIKGNQIRKSKVGPKASKRKSSASKGFRPRRAAARNALTLFSRINGTASDAEDEVGSEDDLSESESTTDDSNVESDELDRGLQNEKNRHSKGKDIFQVEPEVIGRSHEIAESHLNSGGRRPLLLKLPIRDPSKFGLQESVMHRSGNQVRLVGSSSNTPHEGIEMNGFHKNLPDIGYSSADASFSSAEIREQTGLSDGQKYGDIRWGRSRARTSKHQRLGEALSLAAFPSSSTCTLDNKGQSDLEECLKPEEDQVIMSPGFKIQSYVDQKDDVAFLNGNYIGPGTAETANNVVNGNDEHSRLNGCTDSDELCRVACVDHHKDEVTEFKESPRLVSTKIRIRSINFTKDSIKDQLNSGFDNRGSEMSDRDRTNRIHIAEGPEESNALSDVISLPTPSNDSLGSHSHSKKMFSVVYKRSKSSRDRVNLEGDGIRENISNANEHNQNPSARSELHDSTTDGAFQRHTMGSMEPTSNSYIASNNLRANGNEAEDTSRGVHDSVINRPQVQAEEWVSSSRMAVGARSTRNRRTSYHYRDTSPVDRRKSQQSAKSVSWLMLSTNDGSRYIPQQGDEVVYLRQGHQEYIEYSAIKETVPWRSLKGNIRAVEFCKIETLEYSTLPGSGDSCCKMILKFVDPTSSVLQKSFKLTLPEVTGFPDFLVERTRFDAATQRKWTCRDKCKVWWRNEGDEDGKWWEGRVLSVKPKSSEFPDSPWERYAIQYKSEPTETHLHSPWELFDANTQWEEPHIDDEKRTKLLSAFHKLEQSAYKVQDPYGVQKLGQVAQKPNFTNRFPVPLSLEVIQSRLENNYYRSLEAVKHDVDVMLSNAETYWAKTAELLRKLKRLSEFLYQTFHSL